MAAMSGELSDLRATVRYVGRVLGDVIRAQDGEPVFEQIESIRRASVAFHRQGAGEAARLDGPTPGGPRPGRHGALRPFLRLFSADHQYRRGPDPAAVGSPRRCRRRYAGGRRAHALDRRRRGRRGRSAAHRRADRAGDHRPPQRGAPQERTRSPERHRRPSRCPVASDQRDRPAGRGARPGPRQCRSSGAPDSFVGRSSR